MKVKSDMPPPPAARLADADIAIVEQWLASGAAKSSASCDTVASAEDHDHDPSAPLLNCEADQHIRPTSPYQIPADAPVDTYVCYGFDVQNTAKRHLTAVAPAIDNQSILHHILVFEAPNAYSTTPKPCSMTDAAPWKMVTGWAMGGKALTFPPEAGYPQEVGTTHYVVQLHYNLSQHLAKQKDATGFDLCTTDKLRANDAGMIAFGGMSFSIPPNTSKVKYDCSYTLPAQFKDMHILGASPHMHGLGAAASLSVQRAGAGAQIPMLDVPRFLSTASRFITSARPRRPVT